MNAADFVGLCAEIVEASSDAILFSDREGTIRLWNRGAETLFGYRAIDALGQSLDIIIPPRLRQRHWQGYYKVVATGTTGYGAKPLTVPAQHMDGSVRSVEFSIALHRNGEGKVRGVSAVMRDVTEHHGREKALHRELAELRTR